MTQETSDVPADSVIHQPMRNTPDTRAPDLIHSDDQPFELDKQSDLDVPGGKGIVKTRSTPDALAETKPA